MEEFFHFRSYGYKFIIFSGTVFVCLWTQDNIEKMFLLFCLWWSTASLTSAILQRSWVNGLLCWKCPPPASTLSTCTIYLKCRETKKGTWGPTQRTPSCQVPVEPGSQPCLLAGAGIFTCRPEVGPIHHLLQIIWPNFFPTDWFSNYVLLWQSEF